MKRYLLILTFLVSLTGYSNATVQLQNNDVAEDYANQVLTPQNHKFNFCIDNTQYDDVPGWVMIVKGIAWGALTIASYLMYASAFLWPLILVLIALFVVLEIVVIVAWFGRRRKAKRMEKFGE